MKDGISKVKSEIKGVMGIMQGNISKVLDRGAKLEDLQDKSGTACSMVPAMYTYCLLYVSEVVCFAGSILGWLFSLACF